MEREALNPESNENESDLFVLLKELASRHMYSFGVYVCAACMGSCQRVCRVIILTTAVHITSDKKL